jgi:hypothetical protein
MNGSNYDLLIKDEHAEEGLGTWYHAKSKLVANILKESRIIV